MREDIDRWNRKYSTSVDIVEPAGEPELLQAGKHLPSCGVALELACGKGANALYLAQSGLEVIAVDGAINGLRHCHRAARHYQLPVYPAVMDIDQLVLPGNRFHLIALVRYLNRSLLPLLIDALAPGGVLFVKTFNHRYLSVNPGFNPRYVLTSGELDETFSSLERIVGDESGATSFILSRKSA